MNCFSRGVESTAAIVSDAVVRDSAVEVKDPTVILKVMEAAIRNYQYRRQNPLQRSKMGWANYKGKSIIHKVWYGEIQIALLERQGRQGLLAEDASGLIAPESWFERPLYEDGAFASKKQGQSARKVVLLGGLEVGEERKKMGITTGREGEEEKDDVVGVKEIRAGTNQSREQHRPCMPFIVCIRGIELRGRYCDSEWSR